MDQTTTEVRKMVTLLDGNVRAVMAAGNRVRSLDLDRIIRKAKAAVLVLEVVRARVREVIDTRVARNRAVAAVPVRGHPEGIRPIVEVRRVLPCRVGSVMLARGTNRRRAVVWGCSV